MKSEIISKSQDFLKNPKRVNLNIIKMEHNTRCVMCTTFPSVGFISLKWEIVYLNMYQLPFFLLKKSLCKVHDAKVKMM